LAKINYVTCIGLNLLFMIDDRNLFVLIKQGDKKSFETLFRAYYAPLCQFSHKYLKDPDDCEEVVQGFFLKLWDKKEELDINQSIKNYLFSSVRNRCLNFIKHEKIKQEYQAEIMKKPEGQIDPTNFIMEVNLIERIDQCISDLPERRREIFILSREQGLKYREIADQLGISIKTVETQMGQALKELREKLKDYQQTLITFFWLQNPRCYQGNYKNNCLN
jgi:RNA polymerase sigma-70 factor, ECF subfamily